MVHNENSQKFGKKNYVYIAIPACFFEMIYLCPKFLNFKANTSRFTVLSNTWQSAALSENRSKIMKRTCFMARKAALLFG